MPCFSSAFSSRIQLQESQVPEKKGKGWTKVDVPLVERIRSENTYANCPYVSPWHLMGYNHAEETVTCHCEATQDNL